MRQYKISEERLLDLLQTEAKYMALEWGGVDNWEWYGDALGDGLNRIAEEVSLNLKNGKDWFEFEDLDIEDYKKFSTYEYWDKHIEEI